MKHLVGVLGSGLIGHDPFDPRCWSGSSRFFFGGLKARGCLRRAFGVEAPAWRRRWLMARNFRMRRDSWRMSFYLDTAYRDELTRQVGLRLGPGDLDCDFLQLGALYDVPGLLRGRARCFSYHDGNLAESLRSPNAPRGLGALTVDRALAYERKVYLGMERVFAMSEYLRDSFIRDFDVPADRVEAIGGGINLESIPELAEDKRYDTDEILFVGVDFRRKGGWTLLDAFAVARKRRPGMTLHIVGPRHLLIPPGLESGVVFHGHLDKSDPVGLAKLEALFARCSLFVLPSLYEPFGIAPLEAMAYALPCLVSDRWALREMVRPGESGDLVEPGDVDDLAGKIVAMTQDPDALATMGLRGRRRVLDYYTWDRVVDRLLDALPGDVIEVGGAR